MNSLPPQHPADAAARLASTYRVRLLAAANDMILLASDEIHHLLNVFITQPVRDPSTAWAGQPDGDSPSSALGPATT